jgi:ribosomal protein S18 acetylase RimI-like enzyme
MTDYAIRRARPDDRAALSDICLRTADSGGDATALYSDPAYPGLIWAEPYLEFDPEFAFVLEADGVVVGYVIAAHDTGEFEAQLAANWWPALRQKYEDREPDALHDRRVLSLIAEPPQTPVERLTDYPAHLHIDLLPQAQGQGWGRKLIETLLAALKDADVRGVHLGVGATNTNALGFYERLGFAEIGRNGAIWMGKRLD